MLIYVLFGVALSLYFAFLRTRRLGLIMVHAQHDSEIANAPKKLNSNEKSIQFAVETKANTINQEHPFTLIDVGGVPNLRGFGGYQVNGKRQTRRNFLYRSAHPGGMTVAGMNQLKQMGVRVIVNMTSRNETTVPWKIPRETLEREGFTFYDWPIEKEAFSIDQLLSKYAAYEKGGVHSVSHDYIQLLHHGSGFIRRFYNLLKESSNDGVLVHCTLGKDRTGAVFALLFLLVGLPDSAIIKEYGLSTRGLQSCIRAIEIYLEKQGADKCEDTRKQAEDIIMAREENMTTTLSAIRTVYGTAESYLMGECGFSEEDVQCLKSMLLDVPSG